MKAVKSTEPAAYAVDSRPDRAEEDAIIAHALAILESRLRKAGKEFTSPKAVMDFLSLRLAHLEHEVFAVMFLDSQHRLLAIEEMFRGTLTQANVHPREVVKRALALNAGAVVLSHNHPSGVAEPSRADERITATLRDALKLVDVRVLDHIVVGHGHCVSMAEKGFI